MTEADREYDVVLWGATGFTGQLVAEHLAERYGPTDLDWAIAGRNRAKLEGVREDLAGVDPALESLDLLTGDAIDRDSLVAMAERTAVVATTVGPYAEYGSDLVDACVECDTDYCDLSGELHWIQRMVDAHHERARERGVRIVHACGFDSVPSDLGTLMVQNHATEAYGAPCSVVKSYVTSESFTVSGLSEAGSGGSMASLRGMYADASEDPSVRRALGNPYSLAPEGERSGPDDGMQRTPVHDEDVDQWTAPFLMAGINERVVRRSNALLGYPWGREFRYGESVPTGSGLSGAAAAAGTTAGLALFASTMSVGPLRSLADEYLLPDPGEGPSRETIESFSFDVRIVGTGESPDSGDPFTVRGRVAGDRDPGYGSTSRMLGEAAVCLARGETDTPLVGGVLTPASGLGRSLVDRLSEVGFTFTVEGEPLGEH